MTANPPSAEDCLRVASERRAELYDRAAATEAAGRLPEDLAESLSAEGFYGLWAPSDVGGAEAPPADAMRVIETLAEGDASVAWCVFIGITSTLPLSSLSESARREIFASPRARLAGVFEPSGTAEPCDGGFRISGTWAFGSGSWNADWIGVGTMVPGETSGPRYAFLRREDVELLETWDVIGLCGTGSTHFRAQDVFVPQEHTLPLLDPGQIDTPLYRFSRFTMLGMSLGAIALGLARASLSTFATLAADPAPRPLAARKEVQMSVGKEETRLRAARALFYSSIDDAWKTACAGEAPSVDQRTEIRIATCNAVETCCEVTEALFRLGGSRSLYRSSPLQRHLRDAQAMAQHLMARPKFLGVAGRRSLGVDLGDTTFV